MDESLEEGDPLDAVPVTKRQRAVGTGPHVARACKRAVARERKATFRQNKARF